MMPIYNLWNRYQKISLLFLTLFNWNIKKESGKYKYIFVLHKFQKKI